MLLLLLLLLLLLFQRQLSFPFYQNIFQTSLGWDEQQQQQKGLELAFTYFLYPSPPPLQSLLPPDFLSQCPSTCPTTFDRAPPSLKGDTVQLLKGVPLCQETESKRTGIRGPRPQERQTVHTTTDGWSTRRTFAGAARGFVRVFAVAGREEERENKDARTCLGRWAGQWT